MVYNKPQKNKNHIITMPKRKAASQIFPCVSCSVGVETDDEALACDGCRRWQHRSCRSGKLFTKTVLNLNFGSKK